jgi:hypothetical protein
MSGASPTTTVRQATARSRITNGKDILPGIDGRSAAARRYQDLIANLVSDAGGIDRVDCCGPPRGER